MNGKHLIYEKNNIELNNLDLLLNETLFHNANGYIGIRSCFEEGYKKEYESIRGTYINGFYNISEMKQAEKLYGMAEEKQTMVNIVDTQGIDLSFGDENFSMFEGTVIESSRVLNMKEGYTKRRILWRSPKGKELEINIKRMTSFYQLSLFTIEYTIRSINYDGTIKFSSLHKGDVMNYSNPHDPRVADESIVHLQPRTPELINDMSYIISDTTKSDLSVCTGVLNQLSKECDMYQQVNDYSVSCSIKTNIATNETITLTKYTVFSDSIRNNDPKQCAILEMEKALSISLSAHYEKQIEYLSSYWADTSLEIEGDPELNMAVSYNLYQLIQSVGKDKFSNIAAKGLSGEGYEGHYFWDTEMYLQPFFTLTNPQIAKNLISYRYATLEEARDNAKLLGHRKGALYPWRTIMGKECSGYFPAGVAQYHINGDIAYSIVSYYLATKDIDFIAKCGAEILFETARLWLDVGNYYEGSFRINDVTGPDEYTCIVNNNYYTNASAKYNLGWAIKFYNLLLEQEKLLPLIDKCKITKDEIDSFIQAEKNIYLPYDKTLDINPQDDSFLSKELWVLEDTPLENFPLLLHYHPLYLYRHQVCKQADTVLAHFIFEDLQSIETIHNSFDYYEKITTHDSSLSRCIFSIVASKLGLKNKAYEYFGDSAKLDLLNMNHNTKDGIHTANMGGNYMAVVYGFAGLRLKEEGLFLSPSLPDKWTSFKFVILYENSHIEIMINKNGCKLTLLKGDSKIIYLDNKKYLLTDCLEIPN